jgi:hypothetical protein
MHPKGLFYLCKDLLSQKDNRIKYIVVSEFGEEFKGIRGKVVKSLGEGIKEQLKAEKNGETRVQFIPADIGLNIRFDPHTVYPVCTYKIEGGNPCGKPVEFWYEEGEIIYYRCKEHFDMGKISIASSNDGT